MTPNMILDIVIVVLLVPTIVFAITLNSRLNALRKNKDQLGRLINSFNEATIRAEAGIPKLRKAAEEAGQALHDQVEKARALRDDLAFMVDRADSMANKLEGTVRTARNESRPTPTPAAPRPSPTRRTIGSASAPLTAGMDAEPDEDDRSEAERELLRALQSAR
ncbi:MAG: hypothetical protein HQL33_08520 [Alphaproteobacteria bacterium]|nr:hypothetical protein [Alphaproteobacteria bacterium]MBF0130024.1 hypothetical protein [Alphaproteobacteria bacterium]